MNSAGKFSAAPSMAGYLFQCRVALYRCLQTVKKSSNSHVAIEKYDDISFDTDDFADCLIQAKHNILPKSLSDNSVDLWKTIRVWLHELSSGSEITDSTKFILITNSTADPGTAMSMLRPHPNSRDECGALKLLQAAAKSSKNDTTAEGRRAFLALTEQEANHFLARVDVCDQSSGLVDVRDDIVGELSIISEPHAEDIADSLEGWWLNIVGKHIVESGLPPIPLQLVLRKANDIGDQYKGTGLPVSDPESLDAKSYSAGDENLVLVQQMRIIDMPDRAVRRGVQDFYRASAQRAKWARESLLLDGESAKFDDQLFDRWGRRADALQATNRHGTEAEKKKLGRELCSWASTDTCSFRNVVETWITAGSYHSLADKAEIGWHPDFETILTREDGLVNA